MANINYASLGYKEVYSDKKKKSPKCLFLCVKQKADISCFYCLNIRDLGWSVKIFKPISAVTSMTSWNLNAIF